MKVLDASFLIDYLDGRDETREFYERSGGSDTQWIIPVPALTEVLVGAGNLPDGDVDGVRSDLTWAQIYDVDEQTAITAGRIADEIGPAGPFLDGPDALIAAVGHELDAPVVSGDSDLTHPETKKVIDVEEYRGVDTDREAALEKHVDRVSEIVRISVADGSIVLLDEYHDLPRKERMLAYLVGQLYATESGQTESSRLSTEFFQEELDVDDGTIQRYVSDLEADGLIEVEEEQSEVKIPVTSLPESLDRIEATAE
nr:PIN domain-containing protein [Salinilacihabitans rarus]